MIALTIWAPPELLRETEGIMGWAPKLKPLFAFSIIVANICARVRSHIDDEVINFYLAAVSLDMPPVSDKKQLLTWCSSVALTKIGDLEVSKVRGSQMLPLWWHWPCLCKARGGKGTAIKSAGIIFFFLTCGAPDTFGASSCFCVC